MKFFSKWPIRAETSQSVHLARQRANIKCTYFETIPSTIGHVFCCLFCFCFFAEFVPKAPKSDSQFGCFCFCAGSLNDGFVLCLHTRTMSNRRSYEIQLLIEIHFEFKFKNRNFFCLLRIFYGTLPPPQHEN